MNRDAATLALVGSALSPEPLVERAATCCNPFARPKPIVQDSAPVRFAAAITVCGLLTKLRDDAQDERGWRRLAARFLLDPLERWRHVAEASLEDVHFPVRKVSEIIGAQPDFERSSMVDAHQRLETAALPTAEAWRHIWGHLPQVAGASVAARTALADAGAALGGLVYATDAVEDHSKDLRKGRFNPLPQRSEARREVLQAYGQQRMVLWQESVAKWQLLRHESLVKPWLGQRLVAHTQKRWETALGMGLIKPISPEKRKSDWNGNKNGRNAAMIAAICVIVAIVAIAVIRGVAA